MFKSSNPAMKENSFATLHEQDFASSGKMTIAGTVNKTAILLVLAIISGSVSWSMIHNNPATGIPLIIGGFVGGLIFAIITIFSKKTAFVTAPAYALCEGLLLGAASYVYNAQSQGIAIQAAMLTFGVFAVMLVIYRLGIIQVTQNFRIGITAAIGGICLVYMMSLIMGMFGASVPLLHDTGPLGIGISLFIVAIAALSLCMDFDFIENAAAAGSPKYLEWYGAFGLMVTIVWLYLEILRLLSKLYRR